MINCPGYGARSLWKDETVTSRCVGQIGWLIPQPEVTYGLYYKDVGHGPAARRGSWWQALAGGDMKGYGETDETPNPGRKRAGGGAAGRTRHAPEADARRLTRATPAPSDSICGGFIISAHHAPPEQARGLR